jgi:hypothetical protein
MKKLTLKTSSRIGQVCLLALFVPVSILQKCCELERYRLFELVGPLSLNPPGHHPLWRGVGVIDWMHRHADVDFVSTNSYPPQSCKQFLI